MENDPQVEQLYAKAQSRQEDPDGDPNAADTGAAEEESETDPAPQMNDDAYDEFTDLEEGTDE